jgi:tetratricopeptide (TPR) repeat protein
MTELFLGRMTRVRATGALVRSQEGDFYSGWIANDVVGPFKGGQQPLAADAVEGSLGIMGDTQTLIGRGRELRQLDAALSDAIEGRGRIALITGEPGIGKTALARTFVERASLRGAAWAWATCWDGGGAPAYWPWMQIGRALTRHEDIATLRAALGDAAPWIAGLLPELAGLLGPPALSSDLNADQARFRLFDALATLLAASSTRRPLVVVLDDLHWSDLSSLMALEFLARTLPDLAILVVAAYRHNEAHARHDLAAPLGGLARGALRLPLEGLGREEVARLATARASWQGPADAPGIPPRLIAAVHDASAGNPFFVDELVQLLASRGRLHDDRAAEDPLPLPGGVRDTIRERLSPLDTGSLHALRAASVIGAQFRVSTLARVVGGSPSEVLELLDATVRAGLVAAAGDSGRFAFVHALVRDTLSSEIAANERAQLHLLIAEALEQEYGEDAEPHLAEIAHHFLQAATAGGAPRAVEFAARAAERAIAQFAYDEAAQLYDRAIDVAAALPADDGRSWELHHGLCEALMRAGDIERSRAALQTAIEHARRLEDPQHFAQSALAGTLPGFSRGVVDAELSARLEEALRRLDGADPASRVQRAAIDALRCRARVQLAVALFWSPEVQRREQLVDEAFEIARAIYSSELAHSSAAQRMLADRTLAFVLAQGFPAVWGPDSAERGLPISVEALELCERTQDAELAMQVRMWRISLLLELDDPGRAEAEIEAYGETARRLGQPRTLVFDPLHRALVANMRGEFDEAQRLTDEARERSSGVHGSMSQLVADGQAFLQQRLRGRHLDRAPFLRHHADTVPLMRRWRCMLAVVMAENGRLEEAGKELDQLAAEDFEDFPRDAPWLHAMSLLAELCALLGDAPRARRLYELLAPFEGRNVISLGAAYLGPVARYLGLLAMTTGETERALGHLETARSATQRIGAKPMEVLTTLDTAEVLARRRSPGDAERGAGLVQRVAVHAERLGMDGAIARAADLGERLASAVDGPAEPGRQARLVRHSDVWLLAFRGRTVHLQDAKGLRQLAILLGSPGMPIPATALATPSSGRVVSAQRAHADELLEEIAEARAFNDPERLARATAELERLAGQLADVVPAERARVNVTRAIRAALRRIEEHEPELGHQLQRSIRTGSSCMYQPDPDHPLVWDVSA